MPRRPDPAAFAPVDCAVRAFNAGGAGRRRCPMRGWTTAERLRFLNALPRKLPRPAWPSSTRAFGLSKSSNAETLFAWLQLALANRYQPAVPVAEQFLMSRAAASSSRRSSRP